MKSERRVSHGGIGGMRGVALLVLLSSGAGCAYNMSWQPRYDPDEASNFFTDGRSERPVVEGTVARGAFPPGDPFFTGMENGKPVQEVPVPITLEMLRRGRERYDIYCSPCHSRLGNGEGMVTQKGFPPPPTFHKQGMRQSPAGHYFQVIENGIGRMHSYADRVEPADRWAIIAYIRALQLSQSTRFEDLTSEEQQKLLGKK